MKGSGQHCQYRDDPDDAEDHQGQLALIVNEQPDAVDKAMIGEEDHCEQQRAFQGKK
jgi:hypothetical protein